ncbi:MAG: DnaD domain protein [Ruminococcus sp.]|nr:DnaD domain protein [Ruminococcus sp.]
MEFKANSGAWGTMFGVPCVVADNFLKLATGEQIKVLLYLLRCSGRECSEEDIAANTGVSIQEATDAVLFWQQVNVLTPNQLSSPVQSLSVIQPQTEPVNTPLASENQISVSENPPKQKKIKPVSRKKTWTGTEIEHMKKESADISELFEVAQSYLGILKPAQTDSLIYMHEYLGLKKEVIITLISYCCSIEQKPPNYIEKIANQWAEDNINTLEQAQEEVQRLTSSHEYMNQIMRIFEMKRLAKKQKDFIEQWQNMGMDIEMINYAYEKTLEQINELSFPYINKILVSWHESGFKDIKSVCESENVYSRNNIRKDSRKDDDFDVDMYSICINNYEVI